MKEIYTDLIYLLSCGLNSISPDKKRIDLLNFEELYTISNKHSVIAIVNIALEKAGINNEKFNQEYKKSIRKNIMLDLERNLIIEEFEKNKIWYMPLKGSVLKDLYFSDGMRQMADNDILFDESKREKVKNIMLSHGYSIKAFEKSNHDVYMKPPILNFEMHTCLFNSSSSEIFSEYYSNIKDILKKDKNNKYGYHFSDEDFYIYMTVHEFKHYNNRGTGIRSLVDCYVFLHNKNKKLNWNYINEQLNKLGIFDFEEKRRNLAFKVFSSDNNPILSLEEQEMLMDYLTSGTYGTLENSIKKKLENQSKLSFWIHSIFIPRKQMNLSVPFTAKSPLLYPIGVIWRSCRVLLFKKNKIKRTIKEVKNYGK